MHAEIYIETDSTKPGISKKCYGYVLACKLHGEVRTKEGYGYVEGTYHHAVLTAMVDAIERFVRPCEICIHTEDAYVLNMMENYLDDWVENDFRNSRGKPVNNVDKWRELQEKREEHKLSTQPGKHEYSIWLRDAIEKWKGEQHEQSSDGSAKQRA